MEHLAAELDRAVADWDRRGWPRPEALVVSGSGLAVDLPGALGLHAALADVLPFPLDPVIGHPHRVELLEPLPGAHVLYQRGRIHAYQGYDAAQTVFLVRLAGLLGASRLLMTNAAGGLAPEHRPGDLCAVRDHVNLTGLNPLLGTTPAAWGPRFVDLVDAYDPELRRLAAATAGAVGLTLGEGVYAGLLGPSYETPAEIAMLRAVGADLVGMSTVLEVVAARQMGMRCLCLSLVANLAAGSEGPLDHEEVLAAARGAAGEMGRLLTALVCRPELYAGGVDGPGGLKDTN